MPIDRIDNDAFANVVTAPDALATPRTDVARSPDKLENPDDAARPSELNAAFNADDGWALAMLLEIARSGAAPIAEFREYARLLLRIAKDAETVD